MSPVNTKRNLPTFPCGGYSPIVPVLELKSTRKPGQRFCSALGRFGDLESFVRLPARSITVSPKTVNEAEGSPQLAAVSKAWR